MTAPAMPMPESVTIDEIESRQALPTAQKLSEIKLDGDDVPDDLKGKSVTELIAQANALQEALKVSERARTSSEQMAALATRSTPTPVAAAVPEPVLTDEQLAEIYQNEPIKAIKLMQDQAARALLTNIDSRLGTLYNSTAAQAESSARTKFAAEFEVLGPEISQMIAQIPNSKSVLTTPEAWENLISIVRGKPGAFEKISQHYAAKAGAPTLETARRAQSEDAGVVLTSAVRAPSPTAPTTLDATQKEIAQKLGLTEKEYQDWSKV